MKNLSPQFRSFWYLTATTAFFLLIFWLLPQSNEPESRASSGVQPKAVDPAIQAKTSEPGEPPRQKKAKKSHTHGAPPASVAKAKEEFSFQAELQRVNHLIKELPHSKAKVLEIVAKEDKYKSSAEPVKAHSISEITQNQMGAVKVLALKALMVEQTDRAAVKSDLDYVIQHAKDPTIVEIAKAARESLEKGRSFFDDFADAIDNMSL